MVKRRRSGQCNVCKHRDLAAIDLALARGISVLALSKRFDVSRDSLYRHAKAHLPPQLRAQLISAAPDLGSVDLDKLRETEGQSLLSHLVAIRGRLFGSLDFSEEHGDSNMVARITSQLHQNLELTGKLLGTLGTGNTVVNNNLLVASESYVQMRVALMRALRPFPEAAQAVAQVLHQIEHQVAEVVPRVEHKAAVTADSTPVVTLEAVAVDKENDAA
jgi:hypothetical protein